MRSWEVQLAAAMAWLGVVPGLFCLYISYKAFTNTDDMLLIVMPIVGSAAAIAGVVLVGGASTVAVGLHMGSPKARLQALIGGVTLAVCGVFALAGSAVAGLLLILYGGTLAWLMMRPGARSDRGSLRDAGPAQPAPWGSTPGTKLWSDAAPQQGPWSPPPTTVPWTGWKGHSGPRPPWWQTWQAGLAQGIPVWELCLLVPALLAVVAGNVLVLLGLRGTAYLGTLRLEGSSPLLGLLLLVGGIGVIAYLEKRMRRRLEGHAARH